MFGHCNRNCEHIAVERPIGFFCNEFGFFADFFKRVAVNIFRSTERFPHVFGVCVLLVRFTNCNICNLINSRNFDFDWFGLDFACRDIVVKGDERKSVFYLCSDNFYRVALFVSFNFDSICCNSSAKAASKRSSFESRFKASSAARVRDLKGTSLSSINFTKSS